MKATLVLLLCVVYFTAHGCVAKLVVKAPPPEEENPLPDEVDDGLPPTPLMVRPLPLGLLLSLALQEAQNGPNGNSLNLHDDSKLELLEYENLQLTPLQVDDGELEAQVNDDSEYPAQVNDDSEYPAQVDDDGELETQFGDGELPAQVDDGELPAQVDDDGELPAQDEDDGELPAQGEDDGKLGTLVGDGELLVKGLLHAVIEYLPTLDEFITRLLQG